MRLRVFLFKRIIHTIITLLIVLVLLFVIFRLMPGDPTRFFIEPGQTEETRNQLLVKFGFRQWADAPGIYREVAFDAKELGGYQIVFEVNDTQENSIVLYGSFNKFEMPTGSDDVEVFVRTEEIFNSTTGRLGTAEKGDDLTIKADVSSSSSTPDIQVTGNISLFKTTDLAEVPQLIYPNLTFTLETGNVYGYDIQNIDEAGVFIATITARDNSIGQEKTITHAFAVNFNETEMGSFVLVEDEDKIYTYEDEFTPNQMRASIAITSSGGAIEHVHGTAINPSRNTVERHENLTHPQITVPRNIFEQFWVYFTSMIQGDFGESFYSRRPVWAHIEERAPPTILLFGSALVLQAVFGVLIGVLLAWRRGTRMELSAVVTALFFYSMPLFWFGLILIWAFAFQLGWFPLGGMVTPELWIGGPPDILTQIADITSHLILPLVTLMIVGLAFTILLMRNSMLEVLGEDYITTAKAKGLSERKVMYKHAARNAMLPVVTVIAISVGGVVSGGVLTETIFSWPGMGHFLVQSTLQQDYPAVQGVFFLLALMTIIANVVADILYAFLDPRVRL
ncbi:MAG: ABC transporter permease [Methanobacteriota archaeon]|nr:MAG: ABC transporter permease [Euryarchaeota archaeon]